MAARLFQWIGVVAVLALVAGAVAALALVGERVHVTIQEGGEGAARGPDPLELLRADVGQLAADLAALSEGTSAQLQALHDSLAGESRASGEALAAEIRALQIELRELQARVARGAADEGASRARTELALTALSARVDAVVAALSIPAPVVEPGSELAQAAPESVPAIRTEPEPAAAEPAPPAAEPAAETSAEKPTKGFLTFKLPSRAFAFDRLQRWSVLANLSRVGFDARSTLHDFSGATQSVAGELTANLAHPEQGGKGTITVDAASLDTGEPDRDADMREGLAVATHPQLSFEWTGFTPESSDAAAMKTTGTVRGKLTIHGTAREFSMPVRISVDASKRAAIEGEAKLKMSDYGVAPPSKLGLISVEDEVTIWIALRARSLGDAEGDKR